MNTASVLLNARRLSDRLTCGDSVGALHIATQTYSAITARRTMKTPSFLAVVPRQELLWKRIMSPYYYEL